MPTSSISSQEIQLFKEKFQTSAENFAYQLLLLQMRIQEFTADKDHQTKVNQTFIEEITRLMELYMLAVQLLQSSSDKRFKYFGQKIHHLMKKRAIIQQLNTARGVPMDQKTLNQVNKAEMQGKKESHQMEMYFHQEQVDMKRIQDIVKKSQIQAVNVEGRIRNHLTSQQKTLQERIKSRKKRSDAGTFQIIEGSVTKFKLVGNSTNDKGFNIKEMKQKDQKVKQRDIQMQYFVDCNDESYFDDGNRSSQRKNLPTSTEKNQISQYTNRFSSAVSSSKNK